VAFSNNSDPYATADTQRAHRGSRLTPAYQFPDMARNAPPRWVLYALRDTSTIPTRLSNRVRLLPFRAIQLCTIILSKTALFTIVKGRHPLRHC